MLSVETRVPTPFGWTTVEGLKAGDWVFDEVGYPVKVMSVSKPRREKIYRVGLANTGTTIHDWVEVSGEQQFMTWLRKDMSFYRTMTGLKVVPGEWAASEGTLVSGREINSDHYIPVTFPLLTQVRDVRVPPYLLGIATQLRDPSSGDMTCPEWMWEWYEEVFRTEGFPVKRIGKIPKRMTEDRRVQPVVFSSGALNRAMSYMDGTSRGLIPNTYLRVSAEQRLELLQGLLDVSLDAIDKRGDRNISKDKRGVVLVWCGQNGALAEQVVELIRSLGFAGYAKFDPRSRTYCVSWMPVENPYRHPRFRTALGKTADRFQKFVWRAEAPVDGVDGLVRAVEVEGPNKMMTVGKAFCPVVCNGV